MIKVARYEIGQRVYAIMHDNSGVVEHISPDGEGSYWYQVKLDDGRIVTTGERWIVKGDDLQ